MLLLDVGNSRVKWALVQDGQWAHRGACDNAEVDALYREFKSLSVPSRILVSNVAGEAMAERVLQLCTLWASPLEFVTAQRQQCGVSNGYQQIQRLGSDRWMALIAAWQSVLGACLVVNCGTATTVDALSDSGEFVGGLILPGIELIQRSLASNTAQLEQEAGRLCDFPLNTADAIHSGAVRATLGAIENQYKLLSVKSATPHCIVSGGAADQITPLLTMRVDHVDDLVLRGLRIIGENKV